MSEANKAQTQQEAEVIHYGLLDMQVCVPEKWTDEQVKEFAEKKFPCRITNGWFIRKEGSEYLKGTQERIACAERPGFVHIMLDA